MCKSAADGGQRCAAHTRPAFRRALAAAADHGHDAAFDTAAIEHATTKQGRNEVEALLAFADHPRTRLRLENIIAQADQLRVRREAVNSEVNQRIHKASNAPRSTTRLRLVHSTTTHEQTPCGTCRGSGEDYDGYWGCDDCGGTGTQRPDAGPTHIAR